MVPFEPGFLRNAQLFAENNGAPENTYDTVDTKDGTDVYSGIDVAATVQRIKHNTVVALVLVLNDDGFIELLRNKHRCFAGSSEGIDHDVIGQNIQFLLRLALNVGLPGKTDPTQDQFGCSRGHSDDSQVDQTRFPDVGGDEFGRRLNRREEKSEITGRYGAETELLAQDMAGNGSHQHRSLPQNSM